MKMIRYVLFSIALVIIKLSLFSPIRIVFLKLFGAKIGEDCVIHNVIFFNIYRGSFSNLNIGSSCFVGDESMFDLADKIILEDQVTLAERVAVLTHMNVGYADHPLQKFFPKFNKPVVFKRGCFVGCNSTILPGIVIGETSLVAAGSVVTKNVSPEIVVGGVPAKIIKRLSTN